MANGTAAAVNAPTQEREEQPAEPEAGVSPLDIDFLAFALPLAGLLDLLSYIFMGLDAGIVAAIVNIILGGLLVLWMVWRGKRMDQARQQYRRGYGTARQGKAGIHRRDVATRRMGVVGKRMSRRLLKRSLIMYIGNSIPIVNFIPFWLIGVILMLREK